MLIYVEDQKESTKKLLELESSTSQGYKVNTEKTKCTSISNSKICMWKPKLKTIPFTTFSKKMKYSGIKLTKHTGLVC